MATVNKDFRVKAGLVVEGTTATVNGHDILTEALVDVKGDILVASGADAVTRLAAGANGYVLTANSGATNGIEWSAPQAVGEFGSSIVFEGSTSDDYETTIAVTDPTADRTITFPDASGTVAFTSDIPSSTTALSEGTNLYFTDERAQDAIGNSVGTGLSYNDSTGAVSVNTTTIQARVANVTDTEIGHLDGVTSAIQTQLDAKASSSALTTHTSATEAHGATGAVVGTTNTQTLTNKTLTSPAINTPTGITKSDVGLGSVDNTTDANKPISTATQTALDLKLASATANSTFETITNVALKAPLASPSLTGTPIAPTATAGTNDTQIATTAFVGTAVANLVDGAPGLLDTLNELAAAIGDDANFATTLTTSVGTKVSKAGDTMTGLLVLSADPAANLGAATKQYVDTAETDANTTASGYVSTHSGLTAGVHGVAGSVVGTTDTQTLTNKTIDGAANTLTVRIANDVSGLGTGVATFLATPSSSNLAAALTDEAGSGTVAFTTSPTFVTPTLGAASATSIALPDALVGSALATAGTSATTIDTFAVATYSAAKYVIQMKNAGGDIEVIEMLVAVDGANNVYVTEYANVQSNGELGTTNAVYSAPNVLLQVTAAAANTAVKVSKTYIEA